MIVCDTGPLVALSNERDEHYFAANDLFRDLHMAGETLLLPALSSLRRAIGSTNTVALIWKPPSSMQSPTAPSSSLT